MIWYRLLCLFSLGSGQQTRFMSRLVITWLSLFLTLLAMSIPNLLGRKHASRVMLVHFITRDEAQQIVMPGFDHANQILCVTEVSSELHPHECVAIPEDRFIDNNLKIAEGRVMFVGFPGKEEIKEIPIDTRVGPALGTQVVFHEIKSKKLRRPQKKLASNSARNGLRVSDSGTMTHPTLKLEVTELDWDKSQPNQLDERMSYQVSICLPAVMVQISCPQTSSNIRGLRKLSVGTNVLCLFVNMCFGSSVAGAYLDLGSSQNSSKVASSTTSPPQPLKSFINEWSAIQSPPPFSVSKHNWTVLQLCFSTTGPPSWVATKEGIKTFAPHTLHVTYHFGDKVKRNCDQNCVRSKAKGVASQPRFG